MKKSPILGYYGYWVVLTYMAVISAMAGVCLSVTGHIDAAVVCMIFSGVCDMFDGTVARTATRTDSQKAFGIQIDSLADVISFGVLPATVGFGIFRQNYSHSTVGTLIVALIAGLYVLAALIRLAYFNVTEEEMQSRGEKRTYYEGLPVTCSSLFLSVSYFICGSMGRGLCWIYNGLLVVIGSAFVLRFKMPKIKLAYVVIISFIGLGVILTALFLRGVL